METNGKIRLLFICLGNICRSPAAHGIMQYIVDKAGQSDHYEIDSAGIGSWHVGELPDPRMRRLGSRHGYTFNHHARKFHVPNDFRYFDLILVMDEENFRKINRQAKTTEEMAKIQRLSDYMTHHPEQHTIPDPYYYGPEAFELAIELIEDGCLGLFHHLESARKQEWKS